MKHFSERLIGRNDAGGDEGCYQRMERDQAQVHVFLQRAVSDGPRANMKKR